MSKITPEILEDMIVMRNNHASIRSIADKHGLNKATVSIKLKGKCQKNRVPPKRKLVSREPIPDTFVGLPDDVLFDASKFPVF